MSAGVQRWGAQRPGMRPAGVQRTSVHANGLNSEPFNMWNRFGAVQKAYGVSLAGSSKVSLAQQQSRERYRVTCIDSSVKALAAAAVSKAPKHMRTDVDRVVFGHDQDASEGSDNALLMRLHRQRCRPASAMPRVETPMGKLDTGRPPLGASRPSAVRARPSSGGRLSHLMWVQRQSPEFQQEMQKIYGQLMLAQTTPLRPRPQSAIPCLPG